MKLSKIAEQRILAAEAEGKLANLKGAGKPLALNWKCACRSRKRRGGGSTGTDNRSDLLRPTDQRRAG